MVRPQTTPIDDTLQRDSRQRDSRWTESVAVGSKTFVEQTKEQLGFRAKGRHIRDDNEDYALRERSSGYYFDGTNSLLSPENGYFWDDDL